MAGQDRRLLRIASRTRVSRRITPASGGEIFRKP
jgi:hypothetical protein